VTLDRRIILDRATTSAGGAAEATHLVRERVVDARYLEIGNFWDCVQCLAEGKLPGSQQIRLALVDVLDAAAFAAFRPLLLEVSWRGFVRTNLQTARGLTGDTPSQETSVQRSEESAGWLKKHIKQTATIRTERVVRQTDVAQVEQRTYTTRAGELSDALPPTEVDATLQERRAESSHREALVRQQESRTMVTEQTASGYTSHHVFGWDVGSVLGRSVDPTVSTRVTRAEGTQTFQQVQGENVLGDLRAGRDISRDALARKGAREVDVRHWEARPTAESLARPGGFEAGLIELAPFAGSIAQTVAKVDLGAEITSRDLLGVAINLVEIGVLAATLGGSGAATAASSAGVAERPAVARWSAAAWREAKPALSSSRSLHPGDLKARFDKAARHLPEYARDVYGRDAGFARQVDRLAGKVRDAQASGRLGDVDAAMRDSKRLLSGRLAEAHAEDTLRPYAEGMRTQVAERVEGGLTRVDLHLEGLRHELVYPGGRVPAGGTLRAEIKAGQPSYLRQQVDHLKHQAQGHRMADGALTIVSKDVARMPPAQEALLRDALREAGSPVYKFLAPKDAYDGAVWTLIRQVAGGR
jgi:hypothetical protein